VVAFGGCEEGVHVDCRLVLRVSALGWGVGDREQVLDRIHLGVYNKIWVREHTGLENEQQRSEDKRWDD
jgi:hypothetical protein